MLGVEAIFRSCIPFHSIPIFKYHVCYSEQLSSHCIQVLSSCCWWFCLAGCCCCCSFLVACNSLPNYYRRMMLLLMLLSRFVISMDRRETSCKVSLFFFPIFNFNSSFMSIFFFLLSQKIAITNFHSNMEWSAINK